MDQSFVLPMSCSNNTSQLLCSVSFEDKPGVPIDIPIYIDNETEISTSDAVHLNSSKSATKLKTKQFSEAATSASLENSSSYGTADDALVQTTNAKKYKDMMRKRELRQSAQYRQQETDSSRNRMKQRRNDPAYREKERQRDKERRRLARKSNPEKRAIERERDRLYKRRLRGSIKEDFLLDSVSHEITLPEDGSGQVTDLEMVISGHQADNSLLLDCIDGEKTDELIIVKAV